LKGKNEKFIHKKRMSTEKNAKKKKEYSILYGKSQEKEGAVKK
jgi:hypothetical protein